MIHLNDGRKQNDFISRRNGSCDAGLVRQRRDRQIKVSRQEAKQRLQEYLTKQANLERELSALYAIPRAIKKESKIY